MTDDERDIKAEKLARGLCVREGHDPDEMVTTPNVPLENIQTPRGVVYRQREFHPLWMAWYRTARNVIDHLEASALDAL